MLLSLTGWFGNLRAAFPDSEGELRDALSTFYDELRALHADRERGEAAIDAWLEKLGRGGRFRTIYKAVDRLPTRPTKRTSQPGMLRHVALELVGNLDELVSRKAEGTAVLDEFFACYVFEQPRAPQPDTAPTA